MPMSAPFSEVDADAPRRVEPFTLGPTWRRDEDGKFVLPEFTLGWHVLAWTSIYLEQHRGVPWRYTSEQARLTLWWFAMDAATGRFRWRDGVLQRLKGWG